MAPGWLQTQKRQESTGQRSARALAIASVLQESYPGLAVPLEHGTTFQLLISVILSAQCTDAAVNKVTPDLFRRYPTPRKLSRAAPEDIELLIRPLGLYRAKARSIKACAQQLVEQFGGQLPSTLEKLTTLPGVGRKTANVILGHVFATPAIIVDTHCKRLARRLGLASSDDPAKIELELSKILPAAHWTDFSHRLILHGRRVCHARKPSCTACALRPRCPSGAGVEAE